MAALWAAPALAWAQEEGEINPDRPIELLGADVLEFEQRDGVKVRKLIGNVRMKQDSTLFFTDIAYQYEDRNAIDAQGHVRVLMSGGVTLTAKRLTYDGNTKIVELFDDIVLTQAPNVLTTNRMIYYRIPAYGYYWDGGKLRDTANTLTSEIGYYYTRNRDALFSRNVKLWGPDYNLHCDSLVYNTRSRISYFVTPTNIATKDSSYMYTEGGHYDGRLRQGLFFGGPPWYRDSSSFLQADTIYYDDSLHYGRAHCNLHMRGQDSTLFIAGDTGSFNRKTSEVWVSDHPYLINYMEKDTLVILADTLYAVDDSASHRKLLRCYHKARVHMRDLQAIADSMVYDRMDSIFHFLQGPVMWSEANQITGDTIRVFLKRKQADSLAVLGHAFVISEEQPNQFYNQVRGKTLHASIDSNKISYIQVLGNAESIYYAKDRDKYTGLNQSTSIDMEVFLRNNKPRRIRFLRSPSGTFSPMHEVYFKPPKLEGFSWRVNERPRNYLDTTGWHIRPELMHPDTSARDTSGLNLSADTLLRPGSDSLAGFRDSLGRLRDTTLRDTSARRPGQRPASNLNPREERARHHQLTPEERASLRKAKKADREKRRVARQKKRALARYERHNRRILKRKHIPTEVWQQ